MNKHIRDFFMCGPDVYVDWKTPVGKAWRNHIIIQCILGIFYLGQYRDFKDFSEEWNKKHSITSGEKGREE